MNRTPWRRLDDDRRGGPLFGAPPPHQPAINAPSVVLWLIGAIVLAHLMRVALPIETSTRLIFDFGFIPARLTQGVAGAEDLFTLPEPLGGLATFLTYAMLHGDLMHLGFNSVWLLAFGAPVARRLGDARFMALFCICAVGGAVLHLVMNMDGVIPVVGASGAIAGLMGAAARFMFSQRQVGLLGWPSSAPVPLAPLTDQRVMGFVAIWVLLNLVMGVIGFGGPGEAKLIAWEAHLGGFFSGLLAMPLFDPYRPYGAGGGWRGFGR
ncbi:MAG: rhomboid family intramembrane serine protease [Alphaproteobacteria bacterium]